MTVRIRQSMTIDSTDESAMTWAMSWVKAWTSQGWEKAGLWRDNGETVAEICCETEVGSGEI